MNAREAGRVRELLLLQGFTLQESYLANCKVVTGPNGEIYGHMTAEECAKRFLGEKDDDARS